MFSENRQMLDATNFHNCIPFFNYISKRNNFIPIFKNNFNLGKLGICFLNPLFVLFIIIYMYKTNVQRKL